MLYAFCAKIYHALSGFAFVRRLGQMYRDGFPLGNFMGFLRVRKTAGRAPITGRKIRIVFYEQYLPVWNKVRTVAEAALADERYETYILAIPDIVTKVGGDNYVEMTKLYGDRVIDARNGDGWFSLEALHPDYVFFQRPYDTYLPKCYRSDTVSRYAKICYLNYGFNFTDVYKLSMAKIFFRNVSLFFAEAPFYRDYNIHRFSYSHKKGYRASYSLGYPVFEEFMRHRKQHTGNSFRILWTPRYSEDIEVGGTNFFRYKDAVVEYARGRETVSLTFRPHPMLFSHSLEVGRLTQTEIDEYLSRFTGKLQYDRGSEYAGTFWESDVLLTDFSSVIMEYFLTGKPMIYCPGYLKGNSFFEKLMSVNYTAQNWEEAQSILAQLEAGIDPQKEAREEMVKDFLGDYYHISIRILDAIAADCGAAVRAAAGGRV